MIDGSMYIATLTVAGKLLYYIHELFGYLEREAASIDMASSWD